MHELTFEQICPLWTKKFKQDDFYNASEIDGKQLDIFNFPDCPVAEAYGFSDEYIKYNFADKHVNDSECIVCTGFSYEFSDISTDIERNENTKFNMKKLERTKVKFAEHWIEKHLSSKVYKGLQHTHREREN